MLSSKARRELKINQRRILIDSIEMGIPSSQQMRSWGERQLPNGKKVGQVKNSKTVNYKKFTPLRDGLFCERIFGPVNTFVCACGKRQPRVDIRFCEKCEVEYTDQRTRRYRLGYIPLLSSTAHIWYLKGRPSYLSIFLGKRKKRVVSLAYCNAYLIEQTFSVMTALPHVATRQDHGFNLLSNSIKGFTQTQQFSNQFDLISKSQPIDQKLKTKGEVGDRAFFEKDFFVEENHKNEKSHTIFSFPIDSTEQSENKSKVTSFFRFLAEVIDTSANICLPQKNTTFKEKKMKRNHSEQNVASSSYQSALLTENTDYRNEIKSQKKEVKRSPLLTESLQLFSNIAFYVQKQNDNLYLRKVSKKKQNCFFKIHDGDTRFEEVKEKKKRKEGSTVSIPSPFDTEKNDFDSTNPNNLCFQQNYVKIFTLPTAKKKVVTPQEKQNSSIQNSDTSSSFLSSEYQSYLSTVSESKQCVIDRYDRAQTLPFLPTLICKYNLRDELLNFLDSSPSIEDIPLADYCQIRRWQPLRDVHKFMAEQPFFQKQKNSDKNQYLTPKNNLSKPFKECSAATFASVTSDYEAKNWTTKRKIFLFSPYTLSYTLLCQTPPKNIFCTTFFESIKKYNKSSSVSNTPNPQIELYTNRLLNTVYNSFLEKQDENICETNSLFDDSYKGNRILTESTSNPITVQSASHALDSVSIKPLFSPLSNEKIIFSHFLLFPETRHFQNIKEIEFSSQLELQQKQNSIQNTVDLPERREYSKNKVNSTLSASFDLKGKKSTFFPLLAKKKMDEKQKFFEKQLFQQNKREFVLDTDSICSTERYNEVENTQQNKTVNLIDDKNEVSSTNTLNLSAESLCTGKGTPRYRVNGILNFEKKSLHDSFLLQESHSSGTERHLQKRKSKDTELLSPLELITIREILSYTGGGALEKLLKRFDTQLFSVFLARDIQDASETYKQKICLIGNRANRNEKKVLTRLCRRIFRNARRLKVVQLFTKNQRRPEWMLISTLPVLPPDLRPILQMSESLVVASDLNNLYQRVIYRNNRYHKLRFIDFHLVTAIQRLVQDAVDRLIENGKGGSKPFYTPGGRPLKSLSDTLKGKKGRFRLNLLGKRVDFSGRSVIVVSPHLKIHECGLPKAIALELYHYFLLRNFMIKRKASSIVIAKKVIKQQKPGIWDMLRDIIYHHPLLLNRAPTLHRLGIQAFQPKLVFGNAILLHPLVCSGFNADFDGDQMGVHLPLCLQARAEAWDLLWSRNNLLSPATGQPVLIPSQDMVLGFYYMTQLFTDRLLLANDLPESHTTLSIKNGVNLQIRGRENSLLPSSSTQSDSVSLRKKWTRIPYAHKVSQSSKLFLTQEELIHAFQMGNINLHTPVWLKSVFRVENDEKSEAPLEVRITTFGTVVHIYSQYKRRKESTTRFSSMCIRTTVGRVLVNEIIFSKRNHL